MSTSLSETDVALPEQFTPEQEADLAQFVQEWDQLTQLRWHDEGAGL